MTRAARLFAALGVALRTYRGAPPDPWASVFAEVREALPTDPSVNAARCIGGMYAAASDARDADRCTPQERAAVLRAVVCGVIALGALDREKGEQR